MTTNHTPTPWHIAGDDNIIHIKAQETLICELTSRESEMGFDYECPLKVTKKNAAFIVRACNAHDELVEALKKARDYIEGELIENALVGGSQTLGSFLEAALAKARGDA